MYIKSVKLLKDKYPTNEYYPFNMDIFHNTEKIEFDSSISFFLGENATGKSTLLKAMALQCNVYVWDDMALTRFQDNPFEDELYKYLEIEWENEPIPGSFYASETFRHFTEHIDSNKGIEPEIFEDFEPDTFKGQSHGQEHMEFFRKGFNKKGVYFLDEPENALSPQMQIELLKVLKEATDSGNAQFIIATHSPILMALHDSEIFSFNYSEIEKLEYEKTRHYLFYKGFFEDRTKYLP